MFGQVHQVCQCVLLSCKQCFVAYCFRVLPRNLEKVSYLCQYDLLGKLDASILFVQVFVELIDAVFVYNSDCIVNVTKPERKSFIVSCEGLFVDILYGYYSHNNRNSCSE